MFGFRQDILTGSGPLQARPFLWTAVLVNIKNKILFY